MANLDVKFLFTNILPDKTMDIRIDNLYNGNENLPKIPKSMIFVICLTWSPKNYFLRLTTNIKNKQMV